MRGSSIRIRNQHIDQQGEKSRTNRNTFSFGNSVGILRGSELSLQKPHSSRKCCKVRERIGIDLISENEKRNSDWRPALLAIIITLSSSEI